jgi:DNA-binding GntR family transcriptional regulator
MNAGPVAERVYQNLRRLIMQHAFCPGDRLDPHTLAERLSASVTPVREALNVLCGEQLVQAQRSGGYYLPGLDEPTLKDMYIWASEISSLAMRSWPPDRMVEWKWPRSQHMAYADRASEAFEAIARVSTNGEHLRAMTALNARLHPIRVIESHIMPDCQTEIGAIEQALMIGDRPAALNGIKTYNRKRIRAASILVRAVHRPVQP